MPLGPRKRRSPHPSRPRSLGLLVLLAAVPLAPAQRSPSTSSAPWSVPAPLASEQARAVAREPRTAIDPAHTYTLPELIDLAEQHNPDTRVAWQQARAEAAALGIARSELFPALAAVLMTNTNRNGVLFNTAFVRQTLGLYEPVIEVNYLVFDFGARSTRIEEARERLVSSNLSFNRSLLDLLFETERRYYNLLNTIGQRDAAAVNFKNADTVRAAVDARLANGLSTLPDALEARAAAQQANFTLQAAIGDVDTARASLLSLLGASPLGPLTVQPLNDLHLPSTLTADPHTAVEDALRQRPELAAETADLQGAQAAIRGARSAFLPTLNLSGTGGEVRAFGQQDLLPSTYAGPIEIWNVSLNLRWDLFEGGRRTAELARAHADERRAQASVDSTRDQVEQEVYTAYIALRTAFAQRDAAAALLSAAQTSYDASVRSYQLGLRNTVDVVTAQRALAQALSEDVSARTGLLTGLANLAWRTGDLLQTGRPAHP